MDARLILDHAGTGAWNMALDEVAFRGLGRHGPAIIRLYRWSVPTLSLGYFQAWSNREFHHPSRALPVVRRATGGGAIVHDRELTYSLALPLADDRPAAAREVLAAVHHSLVEILTELGVSARRHGCHEVGEEPFLCFLRRSADDLVVGPHKVVGSAQRRQRGTLLQHGSVLLRRSIAAPELPGLEDLQESAMDVESWLISRWPSRLAEFLGLHVGASQWSNAELAESSRLVEERFADDRWTQKR